MTLLDGPHILVSYRPSINNRRILEGTWPRFARVGELGSGRELDRVWIVFELLYYWSIF